MDSRGPIEVALSTDSRGAPCNFTLWDIYTGSQVVVFKGTSNNVPRNCLGLIDNNYFITAHEKDNVLHIWSIFNRKSQDQKLFLPGKPSAICVSPCANYLTVAVSEGVSKNTSRDVMIYIWQLKSGNLLAHVKRHYDTVTILKMNSEGTFLISGGDDGLVLVWPFADLISSTHHTGSLKLDKSRKDVGINEPRFTWQHHDAPVTDIHITHGGLCITSSIDKTINMYSYMEGKRLYSVTLQEPITALVMNKNETRIFLGSQKGDIYEIATSSISVSMANGQKEKNDEPIFRGHEGKVNKLLVSIDGSRLISASDDSTCKIWDIYQKKMLLEIKHQAPLTNLSSLMIPNALALTNMTQSKTKPPLPIKQLKREVYKSSKDATLVLVELFEEASTTIIYVKNDIDYLTSKTYRENNLSNNKDQLVISEESQLETISNKNICFDQNDFSEKAVIYLRERIKELYMISATKIFNSAAEDNLDPFKSIVEEMNTLCKTPKESKKKKGRRKVEQQDELNTSIDKESFIDDESESNKRVTKKLKRTDDTIDSHSSKPKQCAHQHLKFLS